MSHNFFFQIEKKRNSLSTCNFLMLLLKTILFCVRPPEYFGSPLFIVFFSKTCFSRQMIQASQSILSPLDPPFKNKIFFSVRPWGYFRAPSWPGGLQKGWSYEQSFLLSSDGLDCAGKVTFYLSHSSIGISRIFQICDTHHFFIKTNKNEKFLSFFFFQKSVFLDSGSRQIKAF